MIVFTLYMVRLCFILPVLSFAAYHLRVSEISFAMFALAFGLIAAAGYIINDYYDVEIDKVNKPGKGIIGNTVSKSSALASYWILDILGIAAGFWSCFKAGDTLLGTLFLFYLTGLWFYSYKLKPTFLSGNILISIFLGIVPLASAYIELQSDLNDPTFSDFIAQSIKYGAWTTATFAFLSTLIREIVKDMEDAEGDKTAGSRTLPIVWGIKKTRITVLILTLLLIGLLGILENYAWTAGWYVSFSYIIIFVQIPCLIVIWQMKNAASPKQFHRVSAWLKIIMLTGISYFFVFAYESYLTIQAIHNLFHFS